MTTGAAAAADVAVVGAGVSGLAAATEAARLGLEVLCLDAADSPGGCIRTLRKDGFLFELGPNTVLDNAPELSLLVEAAGLGGSRIEASPLSRNRFVVKRGKLVPLPMSPPALVASPLFSLGAKLRILREPWVKPAPAEKEETIAEFTRRRLGPEILEFAVQPFVSGVYAGDPDRLSVRHALPKLAALEREHGSLIRGAIRKRSGPAPKARIVSFRSGLDALPRALAEKLGPRFRPGALVRRVERGADGGFAISLEGGETFAARRVVVALPPAAAARVVEAEEAPALATVPAASVAVVSLGYRRESVRHPLDGFGFLAPRSEKRNVLGCLFPSSLFPGRAPAGCVALSAFVGGALRPDLAEKGEREIEAIAREEVEDLLDARGEPVVAHVARWPRAIPQYEIGHGAVLERAARIEAALPGLRFAGNWLRGISVGDCARNAFRVAAEIAAGT